MTSRRLPLVAAIAALSLAALSGCQFLPSIVGPTETGPTPRAVPPPPTGPGDGPEVVVAVGAVAHRRWNSWSGFTCSSWLDQSVMPSAAASAAEAVVRRGMPATPAAARM